MTFETHKAIEACARRAAKRAGMVARKTQWRKGSTDNRGGFMLLSDGNIIIGGGRFDLSAEDVIALSTPLSLRC